MFYLTTHSTHFIYGYMASDIWLRTILTVRKETCCCHIGYSFRLTARVLLYAPSHWQDSTYHSLCYTSCGALAGTRNSSMGSPHEGSIQRPIAPWANALPLSYVPLPFPKQDSIFEIPVVRHRLRQKEKTIKSDVCSTKGDGSCALRTELNPTLHLIFVYYPVVTDGNDNQRMTYFCGSLGSFFFFFLGVFCFLALTVVILTAVDVGTGDNSGMSELLAAADRFNDIN